MELSSAPTATLGVAQKLVSGLIDAAVILESDLTPAFYNEPFVVLTGLRRRSLHRRLRNDDIFSFFGNQSAFAKEQARVCFESGKIERFYELAFTNGAGDELVVNMAFIPLLQEDGRVEAVIVELRDVSAEARIHDRYKELVAAERARADELEARVAERTQQLTAALDEVTRLSRVDGLTGLLNRRAFFEEATRIMEAAKRHSREVAVLMCDLDHFKLINDTFGHRAGDATLVAAAEVLQSSIRTTDLLGRFGGEEFVVLLSEPEAGAPKDVGERLLQALRRLDLAELASGGSGNVTMSLGIASSSVVHLDLDELIAAADKALYSAKASGRDRLVEYTPDLEEGEQTVSSDRDRTRRILVVTRIANKQPLAAALARIHSATWVDTFEEASQQCCWEPYDAIVVDPGDVAAERDAALKFLEQSFRLLPGAIRVLITEDDEEQKSAGAAYELIDSMLPRNLIAKQLMVVLDESRLRRETYNSLLFGRTRVLTT